MSEKILVVKNLLKRFGGLIAVNNFSFDLYKGEILGLVGPNGAGKTTTFNLITGNLKPDGGRIILEGEDITGLKPYQIARKGILRTFQIVKVFSNMSVFDHILVGGISREGIRADRSKLFKEVEWLLDFLELNKYRNTPVKNLTIPFKKRVELASALMMKPKILLLDELMAGLNPVEISETLEVLKKINKELGISLILVEHIMHAIMNISKRVIVLHYGKKIAEGSPEEVTKNPEVIKAYLGEGVYNVRGR